jgi:hypothetical protein
VRVALLRTQRLTASARRITEFWTWWNEEGASTVADAITRGVVVELEPLISRRVKAIHSLLAWELGHGSVAQHRLTVTSEGVASVRPFAERWRRAAPAASATWEYAPARGADPRAFTAELTFEGHPLAMAAVGFSATIDEERRRVDVAVFHPQWGSLEDQTRYQVAFLALDWALGEDDVERWVGEITVPTSRPPGNAGREELIASIRGLADLRDLDSWGIAQGELGDNPMVATVRTGVRWIDHPTFDLHQQVVVPYEGDEDRWPTSADHDYLDGIQDELDAALGSRGIVLARLTIQGSRAFQLYSDSEDQNITAAIRRIAKSHRGKHMTKLDPAWTRSRNFTG